MSQKYEYFGKYILLEKLATGGMAEVWLARAPGAGGIGKFVAIKKILPQFSDNPEFIQMFKDEAAIAMNLSHSNIVSIYEFGQVKNQLFLVMDYVEGRNLRQILNKMKNSQYKFNHEQIIYMIKEVAAGLDHAHRSLNSATGKPLNITHRDMSPQNIMVTFEGEVKIVDFGIAKAESQMENTKTGTLKGKFGYMSPEQAEGHQTDLRTDIFSLGICLWELLANDRLFIANNEINTLKKIRECNIPSLSKLNPNISAELEKITMKALTRDRNLRYQTAAAMHRDLNRFLNRQYPDFTPHDFSIFIKTLFTEDILDVRKRMIEYSQIPFKPGTGEGRDKTVTNGISIATEVKDLNIATHDLSHIGGTKNGDSAITATQPSNPQSGVDPNDPDAETAAPASVGSTDSASSYKLDKSNSKGIPILDDSLIKKNLNRQIIVNQKNPKLEPSYSKDRTETNLGTQEGLGITVNTKNSNISRRRMPIQLQKEITRYSNSSAMNLIIFITCVIVTVVVGTTFFPRESKQLKTHLGSLFDQKVSPNPSIPEPSPEQNNPFLNNSPADSTSQMAKKNGSTQNSNDQKSNLQLTNDSVKKIYYDLVISSIPSGAEIYVDDVNTGKTTPSRISVPENIPYTITLKLPRFIDFVKSGLSKEVTGRSYTATLQKAMVAYLDIDVKPHHNAVVTVNNVKLADEILPINKYAVPAGVSIKVTAENPLTGASAEQTIVLREEQRYKILLKLDNSKKRGPARAGGKQ